MFFFPATDSVLAKLVLAFQERENILAEILNISKTV